VALFPLPQGALLPGELLPLHVFEPRYVAMLEELRRREPVLAVATLLSGSCSDEIGRPRLAPVAGLGRIVKDRRNADGTSDIVLHGLLRGEIVAELDGKPWRRAQLTLGDGLDLHPAELFRLRRELLAGLAERLRNTRLVRDGTRGFDPGALADRIATALDLSPAQRCEFMAAIAPAVRCRLLLELLRDRRHRQTLLELLPSLHNFSIALPD